MKQYFKAKYYINKFQENNIKNHIFNISWILGGRTVGMVLSFFATMIIARQLGPSNYGQLSYALSIVGIIGFIAPLGLDSIVYRELVKSPHKRDIILGTGFFLKLFSGSLVSLLIVVAAFTIAPDYLSRIILLILATTQIFNSFQLVGYDFLAKSETKQQSIITITVSIIINIAKILAIFSGKGIVLISLILLLESILTGILYMLAYKKRNKINFIWKTECAKLLLKDSIPIIFLSGFTIIYAKIDQVFINHFMNVEKVGVYDAAVRLVDLWNFIPGAIVTALFPTIVRLQQTSKELYKIKLFKLGVLLTLIPITISFVITIFASQLINLIFGASFIGSSSILRIYIWSSIGTSLGILIQNHLIASNEKILLILSSAIPMVINITLNLLWIPTMGIEGAAYATLVSYSLVPLIIIFSKNRIKKENSYVIENL